MPRITSASSPRLTRPPPILALLLVKRLADLVDGDAIALQRIGVDPDLVFLHRAAETDDVGHALDNPEIGTDHPVLQSAN